MKKVNFTLALLLCAFMIFAVGCDSGGSSDNDNTTNPGNGNYPTGTGVTIDTAGYTAVMNKTFDAWGGGTYMSKPNSAATDYVKAYADNDSMVSIAGHDALCLHENAVDNDGYGFAIEGQWGFDSRIDMSGENYAISFDVYIPHETFDQADQLAMQFAFFNIEGEVYTSIYSVWIMTSLAVDTWIPIQAEINTTNGMIDYSAFDTEANPSANPDDWKFDAVRIQCILNGTGAAAGDEILLYVDNLQILSK